MTPLEAWSGTKPDVSHLRVLAAVHLLTCPRQKGQSLTPTGLWSESEGLLPV